MNSKVNWGFLIIYEFFRYTKIGILLPVIIRTFRGPTEALYKQWLTCRIHKFLIEAHVS